MSLANTTLTNAITATQTRFVVGSTSSITAGNPASAAGVTLMLVEQEGIIVVGVPQSGVVEVLRGQFGTQAVAHAAGTPVLAGQQSDVDTNAYQFAPAQGVTVPVWDGQEGLSAPVASATTITASGPRFHITGTEAIVTINSYPGFVEGQITVIPDDTWSWTAADNIRVLGSAVAYKALTFTYDAATSKWYPSYVG